MQHPSKDAAYILSYPRSGLNWFRYCLKYITNDISESPIFHDSHGTVNDVWSIENSFDIKNILLLRNYKECTFSELKNNLNFDTQSVSGLYPSLKLGSFEWRSLVMSNKMHLENLKYIAKHMSPNLAKVGADVHCAYWGSIESNLATEIMRQRDWARTSPDLSPEAIWYADYSHLPVESIFGDFNLPSFHSIKNTSMPLRRLPMEIVLSLSIPSHYFYAIQLKRYYDILKYHNKVSEANANNALIVRYENMIQDPLSEFSRVIDFMIGTDLATSEQADIYRKNLQSLINNIEHHREVVSVGTASQHHRHTALSHEKDNKFNIHSSPCRKEFLMEIDDVLKNKNLELFNKYLSDYSESEED